MKIGIGTREIAHWIRALVSNHEDLGSDPSIPSSSPPPQKKKNQLGMARDGLVPQVQWRLGTRGFRTFWLQT